MGLKFANEGSIVVENNDYTTSGITYVSPTSPKIPTPFNGHSSPDLFSSSSIPPPGKWSDIGSKRG